MDRERSLNNVIIMRCHFFINYFCIWSFNLTNSTNHFFFFVFFLGYKQNGLVKKNKII